MDVSIAHHDGGGDSSPRYAALPILSTAALDRIVPELRQKYRNGSCSRAAAICAERPRPGRDTASRQPRGVRASPIAVCRYIRQR
jgi:hypothetical protein